MQLKSIEIVTSPDDARRARLVGQVVYGNGVEEQYWFEVDNEHKEFLSRSGNPWLAFLLPLAVTLGEPLNLCAPVDPELMRGAQEAVGAWKLWFPKLQPVAIYADVLEGPAKKPDQVASFFSGGVDSFYTLLRHEGSSNPALRIEDLIFISGFDIPLTQPEALDRIRRKNKMVADAMGKGFVDVTTNMRATRFNEADWQMVAHGAALAGVALALEGKYSAVLIAPTCDFAHLVPLGSHPATDPLFSTSRTKIVHDGAGATRFERMRAVSEFELARQVLHICWVLRTDDNCGKCRKCTMNIALLDILGKIEQFPTLNKGIYTTQDVGRVYCFNTLLLDRIKEIRDRAVEYGREDMVKAADQSLKLTRTINTWKPRLTALENRPFVGWPATRTKEYLVRHVL